MNSLNALGNRHLASLNADIVKLENGQAGPSLQGSITTAFGALSRLIDDYDSLARKEMVTAAREKANTRVAKLKTEQRDLKARYERAKNANTQKNRDDLLTTSTSISSPTSPSHLSQRRASGLGSSSADNPYSSLYKPNAPNPHFPSGPNAREDFALREHTFLQESERSIDAYIAQGQAALSNLVEQRGILKGTKTRLLDAANTLGLSRETIGWVERRTKQDAWIFGLGATFTLFCFWAIWHYLG